MDDHDTDSAAPADLADLRLRLQGSRAQEMAARVEARRLARELGLARRLLRFSAGHREPARARPAPASTPFDALAAEEVPRQSATRLTEPVIYHVDSCENRGTSTALSGWAFRPAPDWDARATRVTLLFRHGATVYQATASRTPRPDVAAHYAAQPAPAGGACGLDGAGFACEVLHSSLPGGVELTLALWLECAGQTCEQPTETRLRV